MNPILTTARNVGILISFAGLGYSAFRYGTLFSNMDPFANFRGIQKVDMQAGIQLDNVDLKAYRKGAMVAKATVNTVTVTQDRNNLELTDIHDGLYRGQSNVQFSSDRGSYSLSMQQLQLRGETHLKGQDFDLRTSLASISRKDQSLDVPSPIHGNLMGGKISAASFSYAGDTEKAEARLVHWQGKPPIDPDIPGQENVAAREWLIDCDHSYFDQKTGLSAYVTCKATDGEILVYAPNVEQDRKNDILIATGRVTYFSGKADFIADKVVIYRKDKKAVFTGNVIMLVKPKKDQDKPPTKEEIPEIKKVAFADKLQLPKEESALSPADKQKAEELRSGKNLHDYPVHLQAQHIDYWYGKGTRHAIFDGDPVAKQDFPDGEWRIGWSNNGTYDGEKEFMHLASKSTGKREVRFKTSGGDIMLAGTAEFSTKEEESESNNDLQLWDVSGIYKDTSGEDDRDGKKGDGSKTPPADRHGSGAGGPGGGTGAPPGTGTGSTGTGTTGTGTGTGTTGKGTST